MTICQYKIKFYFRRKSISLASHLQMACADVSQLDITKVVINPRHGVFGLDYRVKARMRELGYPYPLDSIHVQQMSRHNETLIRALRDVGLHNAGYNGGPLEIAIVMGDCYIVKSYDGMEWVMEPRDFKWTLLPRGVNKVAY